jgi:defect-in-organelle-trafficking protein DotB
MISTFDAIERGERAYALVECLRMVVTQALVPKISGGRMGVREWMIFPAEVREKLLDMEFTHWPSTIQRMIPAYGRTMADSAKIAFEAGLIERRWYLLLASSTGGGG